MEKQGMGRRKRFCLIGLLIFFNLLLPLCADEGGFPEVRIETFPASPTINNPWSIYVFVKHPNPLEVDVKPPHFPPFLVMERVRADTRFLSGEERWTRVEFRLVPLRAYTISLGPFEVRTPAGMTFTNEISVNFGEETARRRYEPRFRWLGPVPSVSPGQAAQLVLELTNWNPNRRIPEGFFWGKAPLNAIVGEGIPLHVQEGVYRYPISVIPLEERNVIMGSFSFNHGDYALNVPQIVIPVLPARFTAEEETVLSGESMPDENTARAISFPQARESVFFLLQGEYDRIISRARALWNENRKAEALAELRRNERDNFCGPLLLPVRREIEQELGLGFTKNERWRPLRMPLALYVVFFIAIIAALFFLLFLRPRLLVQGKKIFLRRNRFVSAVILILAIGFAVVFLEGGVGDFPAGRMSDNTAVLKGTYGYRIPDSRGAVNDWFMEGQPVILGEYNGHWRLAETPDGRSGWVPRGVIISY